MNMNYGDSPLSIFPICLWYIRNGYHWHFDWYYLMGGRLVLAPFLFIKAIILLEISSTLIWKIMSLWFVLNQCFKLHNFHLHFISILTGLPIGSVICFNLHIVRVQVWDEIKKIY